MTAPSDVDIRAGFEAFYRRKWEGHEGFWLDWYPAHLGLYADLLRQRNRAIEAALPARVEVALDLGCGAGDVSALLAERAGRVISVDVAQANTLRTARNLAARGLGLAACVMKAGAEDLPLPDESVDAAVLADVIEHIPDRRRALAEVARVLRPGGVVVVVTPDRAVLSTIEAVDRVAAACLRGVRVVARAALRRQRRVVPVAVAKDGSDEPWEEFLSRADLAALAVDVGLRPRLHENICFYPGPEGGGTFAALLTLVDSRLLARAEPALRRFFALVARGKILNQKQMLVAEKP